MLSIILGFIALSFFVVIAKNTFFPDNYKENFEKGIDSFENKNYDFAISYFQKVNNEKYPEVIHYLATSYMEKGDILSCINLLQNIYNNKKNITDSKEYAKLINLLGLAYAQNGDFQKSKFYLLEAKKLGSPSSLRNLQILDSLEQEQIRKTSE